MALTIGDVLNLDSSYRQKGSRSEVLGDAYLLANNPVYSIVRREFYSRGYRLTRKDSFGASSFPLLSLQGFLRQKKILAYDTANSARELMQRTRGDLTFEDLVRFSGQRNFFLHEASHCIAHSVLNPGASSSKRDDRKTIMQTLISEAFAIALEVLAFSKADSETHRQIFRYNSYRGVDKNGFKSLRDFTSRVPASSSFETFFYIILFQLFLDRVKEPSDFRAKISKIGGHSNRLLKINDSLLKSAIRAATINDNFCIATTHAYFRFLGVSQSMAQILAFDYLHEAKKYRPQIRKLVRII